ncbi:unnamed protein product [Ectocarpus sp. 12 AP-2014]
MNNGFTDTNVRDSACALAVDWRGDVIIAGNTEGALFSSTSAGRDTDAFVAKLDGTNGTHVWGWQGGSEVGNDYANAVAVDSNGDVYACGAAPRGMFADEKGGEGATPPREDAGGGARGEAGAGDGWNKDGWAPPNSQGDDAVVSDMFVAKLDGESGALVWGEQFGSGADDQAVGLVLGPVSSAAADAVGSLEQEKGGGSPLYLTGWTRGALFSKEPARWQDGWAVKLPNPPPSTLGVADTGAWEEPLPVPIGSGAAEAQQAAAERGAVTAGLVGTVTGMLVVVSICLYFVLRKANMAGGALSAPRYDSVKDSDPTKGMFRRRGRPMLHDGGGKGVGGGGKAQDGVELTLLSEGGDGGRSSPLASRSGSGGGSGGSGAVGGKRDTNPPPSGQQATFYL